MVSSITVNSFFHPVAKPLTFINSDKLKSLAKTHFGNVSRHFSSVRQRTSVQGCLSHKPNMPLLFADQDQMIQPAGERKATYDKYDLMLEMNSSGKFIPIKLTSLIDHTLLEKISRQENLSDLEQRLLDFEYNRVFALGKKAEKWGKSLSIEQEYPHQKKAIHYLMTELMKKYNQTGPTIYAIIQAADKEGFEFLRDIASNRSIKHPAVQLVRGLRYADWARQTDFRHLYQTSEAELVASLLLMANFCFKCKIPFRLDTVSNRLLKEAMEEQKG